MIIKHIFRTVSVVTGGMIGGLAVPPPAIPFLTAAGKIVGISILGSTPVGWVVAGVALGATVAGAVTCLSESGGSADGTSAALDK